MVELSSYAKYIRSGMCPPLLSIGKGPGEAWPCFWPATYLDVQKTDVDRVRMLITAYKTAHTVLFPGGKLTMPRAVTLSKSTLFGPLLRAVDLMIDKQISPALWAGWQCEYWQLRARSWCPLDYMYDLTNITKRAGQFQRETKGQHQPINRASWIAELSDVRRRRIALLEAVAVADPSEFEALTQRFFPDGWELPYYTAITACRDFHETWQEEADRGVYLLNFPVENPDG